MVIKQVLGLDFGLFKTGLAIGQTLTKTASPLGILKMRQGKIDAHALKKILADWQPDALVIGIPVKMDGSALDISALAAACADELEAHTGLPVFRVDERLTTKAARSELADLYAATGTKSQHATLDAYAAVLILESWLRDHV